MPANPVCWNVIAIALEGDQYALRRAVLSTAPGFISARNCPNQTLEAGTTVPMPHISGPRSNTVQWLDEYWATGANFASADAF